jgi:glycosyl transferase family 1
LGLTAAFVGNFQPDLPAEVAARTGGPWSTETHLAASLEALGHSVRRLQEGQVRAREVPDLADGADLLVWTQTQGLADAGGTAEDRAWMVGELRRRGIPTLGVHLDRWWGLEREWRVGVEPFFQVDLVATADGDNDDRWAAAGIRHEWSPPGVYHAECGRGQARQEYASDVAFVGGWRGYGHREWRPHRSAMIRALRSRYGSRFACWPQSGQPAVRGQALNDLYASVAVVVGDSCLVGGPGLYVSDRVPETWGRGGFLLHPWTPYLERAYPLAPTWPLGDHQSLFRLVDYYLDHPEAREQCRSQVHADVTLNHTYKVRLERLLGVMAERDLTKGDLHVPASV